MIRLRRRRFVTRLGYPILPDQLVTASGMPESFSPNTPDALMVQILTSQGQQLPADLAAKLAAAGGRGSPAPAVTPAGQPISSQTAVPVRLVNLQNVAPGVFQCQMSDGSAHYCDVDGNPISYTPPPVTAAIGPPIGPPLPPVQAPPPGGIVQNYIPPWVSNNSNEPPPLGTIMPNGQPYTGGPVSSYQGPAVTPSGQPISSTSGTPSPAPAPAPAPTPTPHGSDFSSITAWLTGSMFGGIPNWLLLAGAGLLLYSNSEGGAVGGRRR